MQPPDEVSARPHFDVLSGIKNALSDRFPVVRWLPVVVASYDVFSLVIAQCARHLPPSVLVVLNLRCMQYK